MQINQEDLVALKHLQEDMAEYFCDENLSVVKPIGHALRLCGDQIDGTQGEVVLTD